MNHQPISKCLDLLLPANNFLYINEGMPACPSFIHHSADYCMSLTVITACVVFLISNVSGCATGNSFCVANITEENMVPFPRRETLPKPNYIVLPNHQSAIACMDRGVGDKPDCCSVARKISFFLFLWFHVARIVHSFICCSTFWKTHWRDLRPLLQL